MTIGYFTFKLTIINITMENLFYSENEKLAFWVSGYDISSYNCSEIIKYLQSTTLEAVNILDIPTKNVKGISTYVIRESRRYKHMRVFYVTTEVCPKDAFVITNGDDWTMHKWLTD